MILAWIGIILFLGGGIATTISIAIAGETTQGKVMGSVVTMIIALAIAGLIFWWLYFTEGGSRAQKTFESETQGGLHRVIKVYDMQGDLVQEYKGKFDVAEDQTEGVTKIKFDCDGQRHIIFCSTGTVVIDEIGIKEDE